MRQTDKQIDSDDPKIPSLPDDFRKKAVIVFGGKNIDGVVAVAAAFCRGPLLSRKTSKFRL